MDPVLQNLIRYQEICLELSRIQDRLAKYPIQIQAIQSELKAAEGGLNAARTAAGDRQKDRRKLEMEVQDLEVKLRKYNDQLMMVKTNDEYRAVQNEIAGVKGKIGAVEEQILILMEEADTGDRRIKDEEALLARVSKQAEVQLAEVRAAQAAVQAELELAQAAQREARSGLTPEALEMFTRIAGTRNGVALARALDERCMGCKVRLRAQVYQDLKRNDAIVQCPSCHRILYYIPDPPAADATA